MDRLGGEGALAAEDAPDPESFIYQVARKEMTEATSAPPAEPQRREAAR